MKKFIVCLLMLIFLASMVFAEDIEITVDGQGLDQPIRLESGQTVAITTDISAGVMIEDVTVESDVGVFAQLLEDNLQLEEGVVYQEDSTVESYVPMPAMLPAGGYDVQIIIEYQKGGVSQLLEKSVPTTIPSTGIVSDMAGALVKTLPDDAVYEIMNALNPQDIPPLDPGITEEEKAELGLEGMQIREISSQEITEELTAEDVSGVVEGANDATRDALGEMNEKEEGTVEKTLKVYEVTDPATGAVREENPDFIKTGDAAIVKLTPSKPLVIEKQSDIPHMARFAIRDAGSTVAAGMCINVVKKE